MGNNRIRKNHPQKLNQMNLTEDQLEDLGRIADMADNFHAAAGMQLPASMHIECLRTGMSAISEQIKAIYVKASGADPWKR